MPFSRLTGFAPPVARTCPEPSTSWYWPSVAAPSVEDSPAASAGGDSQYWIHALLGAVVGDPCRLETAVGLELPDRGLGVGVEVAAAVELVAELVQLVLQ